MSIEEEEEKFLEELGNRSQVLLSNLDNREVTKIQEQIDEAIENRQEIVQSYCLRSKKYLDLGSCNIDDFDSLTIGIYLNELHSNLEVINLASNQLKDEGLLNMLIGIQFHSNLRELYLGNNQFQIGTAIEGLSTVIPCLRNLIILGLGGLNIDDEDLVKLLYGLSEIDTLQNLQLHKNQISDEGLMCIISMMLLGFGNQIETLYLGQNEQITEDGIVKLFECLSQNQTLKCLHLNDIIMTDKSLQAINISLMANQSLEELNLGNCGIDDEGFKLLHDCLKNNSKLQYLHLWNNYLTYESAQMIEEILENYNSVLKGITLYNNDIINKELIQNIEALIQQNIYFDRTVNNEEAIEKQIQEMKKNYAKQKKDLLQQEKESLLQGKIKGQKNIPLPQNPTKSVSNQSNISQNSTQLNSSTSSKLSIPATPSKTAAKRPSSGVSITKPLVNQVSQAPSSSSRTSLSSKSQISSAQSNQKSVLSASSKNENKNTLTTLKSKIPPKGKEVPPNKTQQQKSTLKKNVNQQANQEKEEEDSDDVEYISLSESINGSIVKREVEGEYSENLENFQNIQKKKMFEDKNKNKSQSNNQNTKSYSQPVQQNEQEEDIDFEEEWLEDDEEDEKELQLLEKQLEQDEEIIAKERNTRLEFIDEFYNEEEQNKEYKKYEKYNKDILQYDHQDPNTLKWQGFFEDKSTGLLKSKYI